MNAAPLQLAGPQLIEWSGALRWLHSAAPADEIRRSVAALGGHATRFRGADQRFAAFHPLTPSVARVHQRLIDEFDPHGVFDTQRLLYGAANARPAG
jgi:glycolate oxidase FAD binding subunit